jgi:beta-1,2-mannosidase
MFYNGGWAATPDQITEYDKPYGEVSVDIKYALSSDLINWEKQGLAVPYSVSKLWAKGAVIPRDQDGSAVKINGKYLMFLSEGCGGKQVVGNSVDMRNWAFDEIAYLPLPREMGTHIYEVACAVVDGENLILDFMYNSHENEHLGSQVRYAIDKPFEPLEFTTNATLAWGGMIKYQGNWCFAQGWDAPRDTEEMYFYTT